MIVFPHLCAFNSQISAIDFLFLFADLLLIDLPYLLDNVLTNYSQIKNQFQFESINIPKVHNAKIFV